MFPTPTGYTLHTMPDKLGRWRNNDSPRFSVAVSPDGGTTGSVYVLDRQTGELYRMAGDGNMYPVYYSQPIPTEDE